MPFDFFGFGQQIHDNGQIVLNEEEEVDDAEHAQWG